ncbi:hypothetical protein C1X28_28505, partial [Pseudomonas sp. FW305-BF15]
MCTPLWRLCAGDLRVNRVLRSPGFQPAYSCHPFVRKPNGPASFQDRRFTMFKPTPNPPETQANPETAPTSP